MKVGDIVQVLGGTCAGKSGKILKIRHDTVAMHIDGVVWEIRTVNLQNSVVQEEKPAQSLIVAAAQENLDYDKDAKLQSERYFETLKVEISESEEQPELKSEFEPKPEPEDEQSASPVLDRRRRRR